MSLFLRLLWIILCRKIELITEYGNNSESESDSKINEENGSVSTLFMFFSNKPCDEKIYWYVKCLLILTLKWYKSFQSEGYNQNDELLLEFSKSLYLIIQYKDYFVENSQFLIIAKSLFVNKFIIWCC